MKCKQCNADFEPDKPNQKFCHPDCRVKFNNEKQCRLLRQARREERNNGADNE